jgi:hypothetical protein
MATVHPRRLFPTDLTRLSPADLRYCARLWAERWLANKAAGLTEAAQACKDAAEHCTRMADEAEGAGR